MKEKIKKFLPLIIWYIILITSVIAGPIAIKVIFGILFIITTFFVIRHYVKFNKDKELVAQFDDWEMTKYGFHATSKKETDKRMEEFVKEKENENK